MTFDWFLTFFERIFNFFAILIGNLEKPFNQIFYSFSIYNPFGDYEYVFRFETSNEYINRFINNFNDFILGVVNSVVEGAGVDVSQPTWLVCLAIIPTIFIITVLIKMIVGVFS